MYMLGTILSVLHIIAHLILLTNVAQIILLYRKYEPDSFILLGRQKVKDHHDTIW